MKSRKVKAATRSKAFMKKLKSTIPIDEDHEGDAYDVDKDTESDEDGGNFQLDNESSDEEEVLPITDGESDASEDAEEEAEENSEEDDLPNVNNWGKKKSIYYNADFVDKDRGKTYREEDLELENAEREAAHLQLQAAIEMDKYEASAYYEDYDRAIELISKKPLKTHEEEDNDEPEIEKLKHEKRKYPKLLEYKEKFKEKFAELNGKLAPLMELLEKVKFDENFSLFIKGKYSIVLQYLLNINFYLYLKNVEETIPENHPIYEKIEQFKALDDRMNSNQNYVKKMDNILKQLQENTEIPSFLKSLGTSKTQDNSSPSVQNSEEKIKDVKKSKKKKNTKKAFEQFETPEEKEIFALYKSLKEQNQLENADENKAMEIDENPVSYVDEKTGEKRMITYEIAKNKGLVPKRKKEYRNPRVHHRMKFRKAKIRRKGQVREVVKEIKRYAGEHTGISAHVVRSVKLK